MSGPMVKIDRPLHSVYTFLIDLENAPWWLIPVQDATRSPGHPNRCEIYNADAEGVGTLEWQETPSEQEAMLVATMLPTRAHVFDHRTVLRFEPLDGPTSIVRSEPEIPNLGWVERRRRRKASRERWQERLDELGMTFKRGWHVYPRRIRPFARQSLPKHPE